MIIPDAQQLKAWDQYTILNAPISSIDLMERAATACSEWILAQGWRDRDYRIFCGKGNNGGDGLAIARQLSHKGLNVSVYILENGKTGSPDFQTNLQRLHELPLVQVHYLQSEHAFPSLVENDILIDALYGSGLNAPLTGLAAKLVLHIGQSRSTVISIDIPSGMFMDQSSRGNIVIAATYTLSFEVKKLALLMAENAFHFGKIIILPIGLHAGFAENTTAEYHLIDPDFIQSVFKPRNPFAHKGNFGHALLVAGGYGKMGAALLAVQAALRSGTGLVSGFIPQCGYSIMQSVVPEAMVITDAEQYMLTSFAGKLDRFSAVGIGPGIGTEAMTIDMIADILSRSEKPLVLDADALNCMAKRKSLLQSVPDFSILTPHPKEFERLFGEAPDDFMRMEMARSVAKQYRVIIVLKGHHTMIAMPGGLVWFNENGNAGMAKGGSGDVLTGILTALLAQGYDPASAALLGVFIHGRSGDLAAEQHSMESMTASDVILHLGQAFKELY